MTGPSGRREWIRWHIGAYRLDLLGVPDKEGHVLARKLVEWEEALRDETVTLFQADVMAQVMTEQGMGEEGVATLGHQRTSTPGTLWLLVEARRGLDRFEALVAEDQLAALLGASRALVARGVVEVTKGPSLPTTMFAHVTDKRLVVDGETHLPEGTMARLAPVSHIEQTGRFTRIHAPQHFDAEVLHVPTKAELYELEAANAPEPDIEMTVDYERPADGWADVTVRVGRHQVTLRASDAVDALLTYSFRRLVRALEQDALPPPSPPNAQRAVSVVQRLTPPCAGTARVRARFSRASRAARTSHRRPDDVDARVRPKDQQGAAGALWLLLGGGCNEFRATSTSYETQ